MASWDDVRRIALDLPETDEGTIARQPLLAREGEGLRLGAPAAAQ